MASNAIKSITVGGKVYPCRLTMGAMMRYEEQTGRPFAEFNPSRTADLCALVWACACSGCAREGVPFGISFMDFCDSVDADEIASAMAGVQTDAAAPADGDAAADEVVKKN